MFKQLGYIWIAYINWVNHELNDAFCDIEMLQDREVFNFVISKIRLMHVRQPIMKIVTPKMTNKICNNTGSKTKDKLTKQN